MRVAPTDLLEKRVVPSVRREGQDHPVLRHAA